MSSDVTTFGNKAGWKFSTVLAFKSRDLVMPKGIDGGEMLAWASADELLAHHLGLAGDARAFWKDGFLLYTLWAVELRFAGSGDRKFADSLLEERVSSEPVSEVRFSGAWELRHDSERFMDDNRSGKRLFRARKRRNFSLCPLAASPAISILNC